MKKKMLLVAGVIAAAAITSVSFAAQNAQSSSITITPATSNGIATVTTVTNAGGKYGHVVPNWSPASDTVGNIQAGDLYTVAPTTTGDMLVTLYLSNAGALSQQYGYFNLHVHVYKNTTTAPTYVELSPVADDVLSLNNGYVTFVLKGDATNGTTYSISVDDGSYYCTSTTPANGGQLSPNFFITVQPTTA